MTTDVPKALPVAVLDACVLYPPSLRDFLMWLAAGKVYAPRFTEKIHEEWTRNVQKDNPHLSTERLSRTLGLMNRVSPGALVNGYESRINALSLPDPNDRHVLAAAIESRAALIVTFNLKDFPDTRLLPFSVAAIHPDDFCLQLYQGEPGDFIQAVQKHRASLLRPPKTVPDYLETLANTKLPQISRILLRHADEI